MHKNFLEDPEKFIQECKKLHDEINNLISDSNEIEKNGTHYYYAIDSSEIFGYLFPQTAVENFYFFYNPLRVKDNVALQKLVMHNILFGLNNGLILIPPYAIELKTINRNLKTGMYSNLINDVMSIFNEIDNILSYSEIEDYKELFQKFINNGKELSSIEIDKLETFLNKKAPVFLSRLSFNKTSITQTIDILRTSKRLIAISDIFPEVSDYDYDHTYQEFFLDKLRKKRKRTSYLTDLTDSEAISLIININKNIITKASKLKLISRSEATRKILDDRKEKIFNNIDLDIIRIPILMGIVCRDNGQITKENIKILNNLREKISVFLKTINGYKDFFNEELEDKFSDLAEDVIDEWNNIVYLLTTQTTSSENILETDHNKIHEDYRIIAEAILSQDKFYNAINQLIHESIQKIETTFESLGFLIQSLNYDQSKSIRNDFTEEYISDQNKLILKTNISSMPYTLQFYSPNSMRFSELLLDNINYSWSDVIEFLNTGFSQESNYEKLLGMAYLLGRIDKWKIAESYARRSIKEQTRTPPPFEGYFFLAYCMRRYNSTYERLIQGIDYIEKAIKLKMICEGEDYKGDPRYLKEKATLILSTYQDYKKIIKDNFYSPDDAIRLLEDAFDICEDDIFLRIQILNNHIYYKVHEEKIKDLKKIDQLFKKMKSEINSGISILDLPSEIMDTIACTIYTLSPDNIKEPLDLLESALNKLGSSEQTKSIIKKHINTIETRGVF